jgi:hypothetical protein
MTKNQENRLSMYFTVLQTGNFHSEVWKDSVAFANRFNEFTSYVNRIDKARQIQLRAITGVTQNKKNVMYKAGESGFLISQSIYSFAISIGDLKLAHRVKFSLNRLMRERDTVIFVKLRDIKEFAQKYVDQLADYGVTQEDIDELGILTEQYASIVEDPRQAITNRSRATKELKDLMTNANTVLTDHLDRLIHLFKSSAPTFYQQFINARKIVNLGHRKRKEEAAAAGQA